MLVGVNVIENIGDAIYEEINSNEHLPETEETDFRSESSFADAIESDLKDESKYEEIDDLQTDEQGYFTMEHIVCHIRMCKKTLPERQLFIVL
jgi:hypothetical protein